MPTIRTIIELAENVKMNQLPKPQKKKLISTYCLDFSTDSVSQNQNQLSSSFYLAFFSGGVFPHAL